MAYATNTIVPRILSGNAFSHRTKRNHPDFIQSQELEQITLTQTQNYTWRLSVTGGVEKPRYIVIASQTDKSDDQEQNPALFDNLKLINAYVTLNSERFPTSDIITNFATNDYVKLYDMFDDFKKDYYGIDTLVGGTQVNFPAFKTLFPIMVFDVRKQNEKLQTGVTDIQVNYLLMPTFPQTRMDMVA